MRTNRRPRARAMLWPRLVLPTPGGPTKHRIGSRAGLSPVTRRRLGGHDGSPDRRGPPAPSRSCRSFLTARYSRMPVLDLLQIEVILVQDLARPADVDGAAAELVPRQARHPLEIRDDHAVLRRGRRETREPAQLALRLAPRLVGQPRLLDAAAELGLFAAALLLVPELLLDGSELLAQVVLALRLGEPLLGLGGDLPSQLAHGKLALQQVDQAAELGRDGVELEQLLAGRHVDRHHRRDEVGHVARIGEILARPSPSRRASPPRLPRAAGRCRPPRGGGRPPPSPGRSGPSEPRSARPDTAPSR